MKYFFLFLCGLCLAFPSAVWAQGSLKGHIQAANAHEAVIGATVQIEALQIGTVSNAEGQYTLQGLPEGEHLVKVRAIGFVPQVQSVRVAKGQQLAIDFHLEPDLLHLQGVVVTATRHQTDRQDAPLIVNVSDGRIFAATQAVSLAEGLAFQPGLRVENNCQNCGFTQLRMNGLNGPYTQILIDSRPVFSALSGVYGLEQIPVSMVDRVEVVRGGGSALYGANAIAGTVNIITKEPVQNRWQANTSTALIGGQGSEQSVGFNGALVAASQRVGASLFASARRRDPIDLNSDGFSELTKLGGQAAGARLFFKSGERGKLSAELHHLREFRRGGNLFERPPHRADVAEQLQHRATGGQLAYETYSANLRHRLALYASGQATLRHSYYGGGGNTPDPEGQALAEKFYGHTRDWASVAGAQYSHHFGPQARGAVLTLGSEWQHNQVNDQMPGYGRQIVQAVHHWGSYAQMEWKALPRLTLLSGLRLDVVRIDGRYSFGAGEEAQNQRLFVVPNPRLSLLYAMGKHWRARTGYARGFRAPQAFDEDLHIETLGGAAQFIRLGPDLRSERSDSFTASLDYTRSLLGGSQVYATLEGFATQLHRPFVLSFDGQTLPGSGASVVNKRNGTGLTVMGANLELMYAPSVRWQWQMGGTWQRSRYRQPEQVMSDAQGQPILTDRLLRAPNVYGYWSAVWKPAERWAAYATGTYTGPMRVAHERLLELHSTPAFVDANLKVSHLWRPKGKNYSWELSGGVQNLFNSFQRDLETGAGRDAGYIYGPLRPRTWFVALKVGMD